MAGFLKQFFKPRQPASETVKQPAPEPSAQKAARPAPDPDAVAKATTTEALEQLASDGETAAIRREAIDRLDDTDALERVSRALKGRDKGAFQAARRKLRDQREQAEAEQARQSEIERLLSDMEELAATEDTRLYQARLDAITSRWSNVRDDADSAQRDRYDTSLAHCRERANAIAEDDAQARAEQEQADRKSVV